ncbi:MAG: transglycosylase SLT domain-containing protein [Oryzomonas sp.]|uniref:lytic transglycosylase domain-containing protein n=1 Tax=Oryzomonas sp. TaxID=2855186 RepID=UPI00283C991D|nr:transglycosylase SLT domain-containing protein [Oryzomonas sp.]MDR3581522.1 transglycosylase SLT domain-containing protein [Oryzomonas sp.]
MFHAPYKPFLVALTGVSLCLPAAISSRADDLVSLAAAQFREKNYTDAYAMAKKCAESPQRSFLLGVAALHLGKGDVALPLLVEAEQKLPLVADYAALYQAEALMKQKRYAEAAAKAMAVARTYPGSLLIRRADKLAADSMFGAGDYRGALKAYQAFVEQYAAGGDSVDALFLSARSREEIGDKEGAAQVFRSVWLNNPTSAQAKQSRERLADLEKSGVKATGFTSEELFRRASSLYTRNEFTAALKALATIPTEGQPPGFASRVDFRTGMNHYHLRNFKLAEKYFLRATASPVADISSEARFWRAKSLERQGQDAQAYALYMELVGEGKQQGFADNALVEAAGLRKNMGSFAEAARLYELLPKSFPESKFVPRAAWEDAWCRYLAGDYAVAAEAFKAQLKDDGVREKALYWLARALENAANADAAVYYRQLLDEYPSGFYATWQRDRQGITDQRQSLGPRNALAELPLLSGFEKPRLLAALGMVEEARAEVAAARKRIGDKKVSFQGLARIYLETGDYGSAIALFLQNRPIKWETANLPLWTAGYPVAYTEQIRQQAAANGLSEGLVFALVRAESRFSPTIRSGAGAIGLMQLMPATARQTAGEKVHFDPQSLVSPGCNLTLGTKHLRGLLKGFDGDVIYSIAAYNAGATAVERWKKSFKGLKKDEFIENIPYQETREYVKKVYASAATYRQLYGIK